MRGAMAALGAFEFGMAALLVSAPEKAFWLMDGFFPAEAARSPLFLVPWAT